MTPWEVLGWLLVVLVGAFVLLVLIAMIIALVKPKRKERDEFAAHMTALSRFKTTPEQDAFIQGTEWRQHE